jgi:hypothetical protein
MNADQIIAAISLAMQCIEDAARAADPTGAPSGVVFAALQAHGMRLTTYQSILNAMVNAGRITVGADHCIRVPAEATKP